MFDDDLKIAGFEGGEMGYRFGVDFFREGRGETGGRSQPRRTPMDNCAMQVVAFSGIQRGSPPPPLLTS